jgi:hypothetical protein
MLYSCQRCGRRFAGYNKQSMQLHAPLYNSFFNFYLGHGYAIDGDLYQLVYQMAGTTATAQIALSLKRQAFTAYYADYELYLHAVGGKSIDLRPKKKKPRTMDSYMKEKTPGDSELERLTKVKNQRQSDVNRLRMSLLSANRKLEQDMYFRSMMQDKENHNVHGDRNTLPGFGPTKLKQLIEAD